MLESTENPAAANGARRLFVGDLHGCLDELDQLLKDFRFQAGRDRLFSVGDVVGKGPHVEGTLRRLKELDAQVVIGNHDFYLLECAKVAPEKRSPKQAEYFASLGKDADAWVAYMASWPSYIEMPDLLMVHAGLEPGQKELKRMSKRIMMQIRTWDGKGTDMYNHQDPPWFEFVTWEKPIVFGHWAERGLINLPRFKGLDTGCVYGRMLTGWCPEEDRFLHAPAKRDYFPVHYH